MDELVGDPVAYADFDRAFHDTIMQASGNRIARAVVRSLESQVINTARYMGRTERSLCVASNLGHRRIFERIAGRDPRRRLRGHVHPHHRGVARPPHRLQRGPPPPALNLCGSRSIGEADIPPGISVA